MRFGTLSITMAVVAGMVVTSTAFAGKGGGRGDPCAGGVLPDLQTVVPKHLGIQNQQQREILRFSNGVANTGAGDWRMRPITDPGINEIIGGVQEVLDAQGNVVCSVPLGDFLFHPEHNHWHVSDIAAFDVRHALDDGTGGAIGSILANGGVASSIKTSFCLIDWYKLNDNANTKERVYWDCYTSFQGVSPGWVDQYHQSIEGQQLDITGARPGVYYLVSTSNFAGVYMESNLNNNRAWTSFRLTRDSNGNPQITEISHSWCEEPGMCGEQSTNR